MNTAELSLLEIPSRDSIVSPLQAVALYDELSSLVYAEEALNALAHASGNGRLLQRRLWSFASLLRLDVRHESIRVASEADIIIVATGSSGTIPSHVISWLNSSLRENGKGAPVMVALDEDCIEQRGAAPALLSELSVIATRWGSPLICNTEFDERLEHGLVTELARRNEYQLSPERDPGIYNLLSFMPAGRWGINE